MKLLKRRLCKLLVGQFVVTSAILPINAQTIGEEQNMVETTQSHVIEEMSLRTTGPAIDINAQLTRIAEQMNSLKVTSNDVIVCENGIETKGTLNISDDINKLRMFIRLMENLYELDPNYTFQISGAMGIYMANLDKEDLNALLKSIQQVMHVREATMIGLYKNNPNQAYGKVIERANRTDTSETIGQAYTIKWGGADPYWIDSEVPIKDPKLIIKHIYTDTNKEIVESKGTIKIGSDLNPSNFIREEDKDVYTITCNPSESFKVDGDKDEVVIEIIYKKIDTKLLVNHVYIDESGLNHVEDSTSWNKGKIYVGDILNPVDYKDNVDPAQYVITYHPVEPFRAQKDKNEITITYAKANAKLVVKHVYEDEEDKGKNHQESVGVHLGDSLEPKNYVDKNTEGIYEITYSPSTAFKVDEKEEYITITYKKMKTSLVVEHIYPEEINKNHSDTSIKKVGDLLDPKAYVDLVDLSQYVISYHPEVPFNATKEINKITITYMKADSKLTVKHIYEDIEDVGKNKEYTIGTKMGTTINPVDFRDLDPDGIYNITYSPSSSLVVDEKEEFITITYKKKATTLIVEHIYINESDKNHTENYSKKVGDILEPKAYTDTVKDSEYTITYSPKEAFNAKEETNKIIITYTKKSVNPDPGPGPGPNPKPDPDPTPGTDPTPGGDPDPTPTPLPPVDIPNEPIPAGSTSDINNIPDETTETESIDQNTNTQDIPNEPIPAGANKEEVPKTGTMPTGEIGLMATLLGILGLKKKNKR